MPFKKVVLVDEPQVKSNKKTLSPSPSKEEDGADSVQKKYFKGENYFRTKQSISLKLKDMELWITDYDLGKDHTLNA